MSNVLNEEKQQQVKALALGNFSGRCDASSNTPAFGVRPSAHISKRLASPFAVPGRPGRRGASTPTHESAADSTAAKPANDVTTDSGETIPEKPEPQAAKLTPTVSTCEPYRETIDLELNRGRNATAIWQDLVDQHGYSGGYQTVKRFVRKLRSAQLPQAVGIILTAPGEEAQVDYGTGPMVRDEKSGTAAARRETVIDSFK